MRPIIIGAGRGSRLNALTDGQPKCYVSIGGRRILDWMLEALAAAGLKTPVFVGGYRIEQIQADYPHLTYCHNADWQHNNILASLFLRRGVYGRWFCLFLCRYSLPSRGRASSAGARGRYRALC